MKLSIIAPVFNEAPWIGYSIMDCLPYVHEFVYTCAASTDGTDQLLDYIKEKYAGDKLKILRKPEYDFNPHDRAAYNKAFNDAIDATTGDAVWFKHPDMLVLNPEIIPAIDVNSALAWYTNITSYANDFATTISEGRAGKWKNIHAKKFGLHYYGEYGSLNEDFYHKAITGGAYQFYGQDFRRYPYKVKDSGLLVNHYCELKPYKRRLEKMKACLKTLFPLSDQDRIDEVATSHPRVTLEPTTDKFGKFVFTLGEEKVPEVIKKYKDEFESVILLAK